MKLLKQYNPESYLQKETEALILRHELSLNAAIDPMKEISNKKDSVKKHRTPE